MNPTSAPRPAPSSTRGRNSFLLAGACFILGAALAGLWFHHSAPAVTPDQPSLELATGTKAVLAQLTAPVTIHYYSLLPAGGTDDPLSAFAGRVGQLLAAMQAAANGKLVVTTISTSAETNANAAAADGLQAFNLEKGESSFLGLALASGKNKEILPRLQPEWESAVESDIARALSRVALPDATVAPIPAPAQPTTEVISAINRLIPDVNSTSVETANQIFHAEFMKEISEAGVEMEARMTAAQQQVIAAQASGSPADLEAAQKNLSQVQLAQSDKIKQIAAQLQTRLAAYQQLKNNGAPPK